MRRAVLNSAGPCTFFRELDRFPRHIGFRELSGSGNAFDRVAIPIACEKIHRAVDAGWIETERFFHLAQALHKLSPVQSAKEPQTVNGVAHRDLVSRLVLALQLHELLDDQPLFVQPLIQPGPRQMHHGALS